LLGVIPIKLLSYDDILTKNNKNKNDSLGSSIMDRLNFVKVAVALIPLIFILPLALAEDVKNMGEDYYENDINAAVMEASQNKRELKYNRQHWYNRTTAKSFELNPLKKGELEIERLEGALGKTAAGERSKNTNPEFPAEKQAKQIQKDFLTGDTDSNNTPATTSTATDSIGTNKALPSGELKHEFPRGDVVTTKGITTKGTITSTARP
jgi:hypothetical protein